MSGLACWLRTQVEKEKGGEGKKKEKRGGNAQVIPQYSRTENAYGEEVTSQTSVSAEKAGD